MVTCNLYFWWWVYFEFKYPDYMMRELEQRKILGWLRAVRFASCNEECPEQFEDNATQSCYWELQKFLTTRLKAHANILECLFSPMVEKITADPFIQKEPMAIAHGSAAFRRFGGWTGSSRKSEPPAK